MTTPYNDPKTRHHLRTLARKGRLVDEAFCIFQQVVFPGAGPEQVNDLRIAFFGGASEIHALMIAALDQGLQETDGDMKFMEAWVKEIEDFHTKTVTAMQAPTGGRPT
jgi:hypothetical protein